MEAINIEIMNVISGISVEKMEESEEADRKNIFPQNPLLQTENNDDDYDRVATGEIQCFGCKDTFRKTMEFIAHKKCFENCRTMHCELCLRVFNRKDSVLQHYTTHSDIRPHHCTKCDRSFKRKATLDLHERTHTDYRPYECEICSKGFHLKSGLQGHMRVHAAEKSFKCPMCPKRYGHKNGLARHIKVHKGLRNYCCNECGKRFVDKDGLIRHMQTHLDASVRRFPCPHCSKGFAIKHDLKLHLFTHSGERPLKCNICGNRFIKANVLKKHKELHKRPIPYPCGYCSLIFVSLEDLKIHRRRGCGKAPEIQSDSENDGDREDIPVTSESIMNDALSQLMNVIKEDTAGDLEEFNRNLKNKEKGVKFRDNVSEVTNSILRKIISVNQLEIDKDMVESNLTESGAQKQKCVRVKLPEAMIKTSKPRRFIIIKEIID